MAICAALYALVNGMTAAIGTPWNVGQFRPGVVVPAIFALTSGTMVGAVGAGIGSFVGDILFLVPMAKTTPLLAVAAGLPGNFIGFLLFGWIVHRYRSWVGFIFSSMASLLVGNLIAALGVVVLALPADSAAAFWVGVWGLTLFWEFTMLPFMILLVPVVMRYLRGITSSRIWGESIPHWEDEPMPKVLLVSALLSLPFFAAGFLSLFGYFNSLYGTNQYLGSLLQSLMTVFLLGIAVTLVVSPLAPKIAGPRRGRPEVEAQPLRQQP